MMLSFWSYPKCKERSDPLCKFCGDNSSFNQIIKFRKKNITLFQLYFMQLFSADATIFLKKC